jgi:hypothetical protein
MDRILGLADEKPWRPRKPAIGLAHSIHSGGQLGQAVELELR